MDIRVKFLGAAQSVTGSKYLLEVDDHKILVDCGLFQGLKELRLRNWDAFPIDIFSIDQVVLTHAHLDHTGYLPKLFKEGYVGPVYCSNATEDLVQLILLDSAKLQEEEAHFARKKGYSKHEEPQPLYHLEDAKLVFPYLKSFEYDTDVNLTDRISVKFHDAGHLLGSSILEFTIRGDNQVKKIVFSGDIGRNNQSILRDPTVLKEADIVFIESTYGDRDNPVGSPKEDLKNFVLEALENKGCILIPAFSIGRTQHIINYLKELLEEGQIPDIPVYIDSPMAISATDIYKRNYKYHKLSDHELGNTRRIFEYKNMQYCREQTRSVELNGIKSGAIIISASGMCTGGRILHHLFHRLPRENDTLLFVGYQAEGSRGRKILDGGIKVKIFGEEVPVKCQVRHLEGLSAHADKSELMQWLGNFERSPKFTFVIHGEKKVCENFARTIRQELGWNVHVPAYFETVELFKGI
jgi:metallo-beta-lactamase family protein